MRRTSSRRAKSEARLQEAKLPIAAKFVGLGRRMRITWWPLVNASIRASDRSRHHCNTKPSDEGRGVASKAQTSDSAADYSRLSDSEARVAIEGIRLHARFLKLGGI